MSHKGRTVYKLQGAETCQRTQHNSAIIGTRNTCAVLAVNLLKHVGSPDTMLKVTQLHGVMMMQPSQNSCRDSGTRASEELCIAVVVAACCAVLAGWLLLHKFCETSKQQAYLAGQHS